MTLLNENLSLRSLTGARMIFHLVSGIRLPLVARLPNSSDIQRKPRPAVNIASSAHVGTLREEVERILNDFFSHTNQTTTRCLQPVHPLTLCGALLTRPVKQIVCTEQVSWFSATAEVQPGPRPCAKAL